MKEQILELRKQGLTYNQICNKVGCSKATVSYHCGEGQKEKNRKRTQNRRKSTVISQKVERFQYKKIKNKTEDFQRLRIRKNGQSRLGKRKMIFSWKDVIEKFGWKTVCYLTGRLIDLREPLTYEFDHIIPYAKGGENTLDNLGIVCRESNRAKNSLSVEEFLTLCKNVLEHHGYVITKKNIGS
jgi:5-methylcytosine-specific restriction endonuclease McrA